MINKKVVRVHQLARKFGWENDQITSTLKSAGIKLHGNSSNSYLDSNHIQVLAFEYKNTVKKLFKKLSEKSHINSIQRKQHESFFERFIKSDYKLIRINSIQFKIPDCFYYDENNILQGFYIKNNIDQKSKIEAWSPKFDVYEYELDDELIHRYFIRVAYSSDRDEYSREFLTINSRIKLKLKKPQTKGKRSKRIFAIYNRKCIFSADEDHLIKVVLITFNMFFSNIQNIREGIINFNSIIIWKISKNRRLLSV